MRFTSDIISNNFGDFAIDLFVCMNQNAIQNFVVKKETPKAFLHFETNLLELHYDLLTIVYYVVQARYETIYNHSYPASKIDDLYVFYLAAQRSESKLEIDSFFR